MIRYRSTTRNHPIASAWLAGHLHYHMSLFAALLWGMAKCLQARWLRSTHHLHTLEVKYVVPTPMRLALTIDSTLRSAPPKIWSFLRRTWWAWRSASFGTWVWFLQWITCCLLFWGIRGLQNHEEQDPRVVRPCHVRRKHVSLWMTIGWPCFCSKFDSFLPWWGTFLT